MLRLVLGTAQLMTRYGATDARQTDPTDHEALDLLATAAEVGITALDTAPAYGDAERVIGLAPTAFEVHTKVAAGSLPSASLARSTERLGHQRIGVLYLHDPDEVRRVHGPAMADARHLIADHDVALGASVYDEVQFAAALDDPAVTVVQVPLNLLDRRFSGRALEAAAASGTAVIVRSVLLQGVLAADPDGLAPHVAHLRPHVATLAAIAERHGLTQLELALGWVASLPHVAGVVTGATAPAELRQLVAASGTVPGADVLGALDELELPDSAACDPRRWAA